MPETATAYVGFAFDEQHVVWYLDPPPITPTSPPPRLQLYCAGQWRCPTSYTYSSPGYLELWYPPGAGNPVHYRILERPPELVWTDRCLKLPVAGQRIW